MAPRFLNPALVVVIDSVLNIFVFMRHLSILRADQGIKLNSQESFPPILVTYLTHSHTQ